MSNRSAQQALTAPSRFDRGQCRPSSSGTTRLKTWVKRSLKILLIVFFRVLNAHSFSRVEPLLWAIQQQLGLASAVVLGKRLKTTARLFEYCIIDAAAISIGTDTEV
ncbi:hypothetical protein [Chamaesiphon sp.]|uniref:hypothetical protein n=1 Tax=Chamaesiphon sp. TaxID=2814140 RepID=UPI0035939D5C